MQPSDWRWYNVGRVDPGRVPLLESAWIPARVPGHVQCDLIDAGRIPDPGFHLNSLACEWTSQRDWIYRLSFPVSASHADRHAVLRLEGVDWSCHVFLNGQSLGDYEGMYRGAEIDVSGLLRAGETNLLVIVVDHAPPEEDVQSQNGWTSRVRVWKPRFAYVWDWSTRLVPVGLWDSVVVDIHDGVRITDCWVRPVVEVRDCGAKAQVTVTTEVAVTNGTALTQKVRLFDSRGAEVGTITSPVDSGVAVSVLEVDDAQLWWPNGSGGQPLYTAEVEIFAAGGEVHDRRKVRFALRVVRFVANQGAPEGALPYTAEVNGRRLFLKGWNWVPIDQLYGRLHENRYRNLIELARRANSNVLRVCGVGLLERELFYDLCDEAGLLVWQDFIQCSSRQDNHPAEDADYIAHARQQAEQMVVRRRNHPSLLLWSGGNELRTLDGIPLTTAHTAVATMEDVVRTLDPGRHFIATSPSGPPAVDPEAGHDIHGPWRYLGDGAHYRFYNETTPLLHSELGVEGACGLTSLRRTLEADSLWPPDFSNRAWVHHGEMWVAPETVAALFGPITGIEDYVRASQWVQAEGLGYAVEAHRRRQGHTSGAIIWQLNEAWPNANSPAVVDYDGAPRPAYWRVRNAYRTVVVSAEYERLGWANRHSLDLNIFVVADEQPAPPATISWRMVDVATGTPIAGGKHDVDVAAIARGERRVAALSVPVSSLAGVISMHLDLTAGDTIVARNQYFFSSRAAAPLAPLLRLPHVELSVRPRSGGVIVALPASGAGAVGLSLAPTGDHAGLYPDEGYFGYICAGETLDISVEGMGELVVAAWNSTSYTVKLD
jgi:beta-mannosidase